MSNGYYIPGLYIEDHEVTVPLDWRGIEPHDFTAIHERCDHAHLTVFYRVVCAPDKVHEDLPLLVFLQGGPGGKSPRPLNPQSDGWINEAIKHFRVILPDQRGTGRSSQITGAVIQSQGTAQQQADYLKRFLADSIIRDFEYIRLTDFHGKQWVSEGQSYGGFLTLTYLSLYPEALLASFTTGGIPAVPADDDELYRHTYDKCLMKNQQYFDRYPHDQEIITRIADELAEGTTQLPNGDPFTVHRLQALGQSFGMKPSFEKVHWMLDTAFDGNGHLSTGFCNDVYTVTTSYGNELYWTLQEGIYMNGGDTEQCAAPNWAAQRELDKRPEFSDTARPLLFTGEMSYPWRFNEDAALRPFRDAEEIFMQSTDWGKIYDLNQLQHNEVPLQSAVYYNDMYVPRELSMRTLNQIPHSHPWVTTDYEHDGVHGDTVFPHLFELALNRGDLTFLH